MIERLSQQALARRVKRRLKGRNHSFMASCAPGLESVLQTEIARLPGVRNLDPTTGGVEFDGPLDTFYLANLQLRTAHRVLLRISEFLAQTPEMLFGRARKLPWELYIGFAPRVALSVSASKSRLLYPRRIAQTLFEAALDRLRPLGLAPEIAEDAPVLIYARLHRDRCTLSVDTSGDHLHKRGYRLGRTPAPMRETLAAGVLLASGASRHDLILDPFCGSGTLPIEAALITRRLPTGANRSFAFEHLPFHQDSKWRRLRSEALTACVGIPPTAIMASDIDEHALHVAHEAARRAGVADNIAFLKRDAMTLDLKRIRAQRPLLIGNLPYGKRLEGAGLDRQLHYRLATKLRREGAGWSFALVARQPEWLARAGLGFTRKASFKNGGLRVYLLTGTLRHRAAC